MVMNKRKVTIGLCLVVFALGIVYGWQKESAKTITIFPMEMRTAFLESPTFDSYLDIILEYQYFKKYSHDVFIYNVWTADKYEGEQAECAEKEMKEQLMDSLSVDSIPIFTPNNNFLSFAQKFLQIK
jgi:hypothetical protein